MQYDIKNLTLEEKLNLLTGADNWRTVSANGKLKEVFMADGPHGLRKMNDDNSTVKSTAMPSLSMVANTWNEDMAYLQGETIADECLQNDVDVLLAPGVNIKRTPLCGRNFEYFSEDPYLAGKMARGYIEGVQSKGVGATIKHYYGNNREYDRFHQSSEIDKRTAMEIYLPAFEEGIKAKPWLTMCSYNLINGVYASENKQAFDLLRNELKFDGAIVSDWGAVVNSAKAVKAGLDLRMPFTPDAYTELKTAYDEGWLSMEEIDACVARLLEFIEKTQTLKQKPTTDKQTRHNNAVKIASEAMVLLKNEDNVLPIKSGKVMITGPYQHAHAFGGGSSNTTTDYPIKPICEYLNQTDGIEASFPDTIYTHGDYVKGLNRTLKMAYTSDVCVFVVGNNHYVEAECFDRTSLKMSAAQERMILDTAKINPNVVVVLEGGGVLDISNIIDKVKAVVYAGFSGEATNEVIADILTGKINPSGKLTETFPLSLEDTPTGSSVGTAFVDRYQEGVFVGYRYYDSYEKDVLFPFGHGLSYSKFDYSDLSINKLTETDYTVSFKVKNTSNVDGAEIAELYVKDVFALVSRPEKELKGFKKVFLKAGEETTVELSLDYRSFAYYSLPLEKWHVENGAFEILVGSSSRNILLSDKIEINLPFKGQVSDN